MFANGQVQSKMLCQVLWAAQYNAWLLIKMKPKDALLFHPFLLHRLVMCFQIKAFREELKLLQAALRAFPAALRSLQEALGHPPAAQGKCACCCKCSCQRRRPYPCPSPHTLLLLLLLQGSAKHRSGHYEKVHCAAIMVLETCTPVNFTCYTSACSAAALPVAANGMLLQAGRCTDCCLMVKLALTGLSHCFFDSDTQFPQV